MQNNENIIDDIKVKKAIAEKAIFYLCSFSLLDLVF